jgi:hypothetical protein
MSRAIGLNIKKYTTNQLNLLVTNYGPSGTVQANSIDVGTLVYDKTVNRVKSFNGTTFITGVDSVPATLVGTFRPESFGYTNQTDAAPYVRLAQAAAIAAGGGEIVFGAGKTYSLRSAGYVSFGQNYILGVESNNLTFRGEPGHSITVDLSGAALLAVNTNRFTDWQSAPVRTIAPAAYGDISITCTTPAQAGNFAVGDWVWIRTGETLGGVQNPDSEINRVTSVNTGTGVIGLRFPLCKAYAQEYYTQAVNAGGIPTTTSVTAYPAPLGVVNVNAFMVENLVLDNLNIISAQDRTLIAGGQTFGFNIVNCTTVCIGSFQSMSAHRATRIERNHVFLDNRTTAQPVGARYFASLAYASSDCHIDDNIFISNDEAFVHAHEGVASSTISRNIISTSKPSGGSATLVSVRARGYDIAIVDNQLKSVPGVSSVVIENTVLGGGLIAGNNISGANTVAAISCLGRGFRVVGNRDATRYAVNSNGALVSQTPVGNYPDNTETIFIPASAFYPVVGTSTFGLTGASAFGWSMPTDVDTFFGASIMIPDGWQKIKWSTITANTVSSTTGSVRHYQNIWYMRTDAIPDSTSNAPDYYETIDSSVNNTAFREDFGGVVGTLVDAKRMLAVKAGRNGADAADTFASTITFLGFRIRRIA